MIFLPFLFKGVSNFFYYSTSLVNLIVLIKRIRMFSILISVHIHILPNVKKRTWASKKKITFDLQIYPSPPRKSITTMSYSYIGLNNLGTALLDGCQYCTLALP